MTTSDWEREFADYAAARSRLLCTTAYLICGDWHRAEDHTQTALTKLYLAWRRIDRRESVDAYARRVLVRTVLDERRRREPDPTARTLPTRPKRRLRSRPPHRSDRSDRSR